MKRTAQLLIGLLLVGLFGLGGWGYTRGYRVRLVKTSPMPIPVAPFGVADNGRLDVRWVPGQRPRNVILIVGDGLGFSHLVAARAVGPGMNRPLFVERLPVVGWLRTHSAENIYTDSAAAAAAFATGAKTRPRMLGRSPQGRFLPTLLESGLAAGMRGGLITTSVILDATPAAFVAHVNTRYDWLVIAQQMAASGVELMISEGVEGSSEESRERIREGLETFETAGYRLARSWEQLQADAAAPKLLGWLEPRSLTHRRSPRLAELTAFALARLAGASGGFFLLVEDEDTDTGSHRQDLPRVLRAITGLDEAVREAVGFAREDGETLVLVTADHETGGLTIFGGAEGEPLDHIWATDDHTALPVPIFAYGPGAERFTAALDNTEVATTLADLLGLELRRRWPGES